MQSSKQKRQKKCTLTLQFFTNSISYQGCSTLMCDVINSLRRTVNFSIRLTSSLKVYAGESLKCNRNSFQRTGESFSTLRQQTGCGTRLFSSFLAYIYKKYIAHGGKLCFGYKICDQSGLVFSTISQILHTFQVHSDWRLKTGMLCAINDLHWCLNLAIESRQNENVCKCEKVYEFRKSNI